MSTPSHYTVGKTGQGTDSPKHIKTGVGEIGPKSTPLLLSLQLTSSLLSPIQRPAPFGTQDELSVPATLGQGTFNKHSLHFPAEGLTRAILPKKETTACLKPLPPGRNCLISSDIVEVVLVAGLNYRDGMACGYALGNQPQPLSPLPLISLCLTPEPGLTTVFSAAANFGTASLAMTPKQDTTQSRQKQTCQFFKGCPKSFLLLLKPFL